MANPLKNTYAECQEDSLDEILMENGYKLEDLSKLYPEEKEAIVLENNWGEISEDA